MTFEVSLSKKVNFHEVDFGQIGHNSQCLCHCFETEAYTRKAGHYMTGYTMGIGYYSVH